MTFQFLEQVELKENFSRAEKWEKKEHSRYQINQAKYGNVLIKNIPFIFTCDESEKLRFFKNYSIVISGDTIEKVVPAGKIKEENFDVVYDAGKRGGVAVLPGLVNAHAHPPMYLLRSSMDLDEGENINETLANLPLWEGQMTQEDRALSTVGDFTEEQKFGITTTLSHYNNFEEIEAAAQLTGQNVVNAISVASHVAKKNSPALIRGILQKKKPRFSKLAMAVHYLHKATPKILQEVAAIQKKENLLFTCHLAESEKVLEDTQKKLGMREVKALEKFGLLNEKTLVSHAIHLGKRDIEKLVQEKVGIAHLPTSNRIHKSGKFPFWDFFEAGGFSQIALGTDSVVSKSRLDILTEAYQARATHLYRRTIKFGSLFKMMTSNGARVLGMPDRGKILPGGKADLTFWKLKDRSFVPYDSDNPFSLIGNIITHSGKTARDVMVNGRFVIKSRRHQKVNESRLLELLQKRHMQMRKKVKRVTHNS